MSPKDTRSRLAIWGAALQRLVMWHGLSSRLPLYLVPEFPKSGGSWFSQMLSDYLEVPFPRNERPPLWEPCVMQGHHTYHERFDNIFCILRDGRDVMVSAYFHYLQHHDRNPPHSIVYHRDKVPFADYEDVRGNLPAFIDYMFTVEGQRWNRFTWDEFIRSYKESGREDIAYVRYEDMLEDAAGEVGRAVEKVVGKPPDRQRLEAIEEKYSFENQTGRKRGEEQTGSFARKGIAGDWKNKFTREACEVFDRHAGDMLIELGYEQDRSWIDEQAERADAGQLDV